MGYDKKKIYSEHSRFVYSIALRILRSKQDAEDAAQNVFIKLFSKLDTFRGEADIKTFIYRVTVNESIDLIRRNRMAADKAEKSFEKPLHRDPHDKLLIDDLLSGLPEEQKAPILLAEIKGFSYAEIAEIMGVKMGTVKSRINRGYASLLNKLQEAKKNGLSETV